MDNLAAVPEGRLYPKKRSRNVPNQPTSLNNEPSMSSNEPPTTAAAPFCSRLEHAERCWRAEEENSRRLSVRQKVLTTVTLGLFGVVVFKLGGDAIDAPRLWSGFPPGVQWTVVGGLFFGLLSLVASFCLQLDILRLQERRAPSSTMLRLTPELAESIDLELKRKLYREEDA